MKEDFLLRNKVNEFIKTVALGQVKAFYPSAVAKYTKTSSNQVFPKLINSAQNEEIELLWEVRCPDFECGNIVDVSKEKNFDHNLICDKCGNEFKTMELDFFPRFVINPYYKEALREADSDKKKQQIPFIKMY
uniref:hypothetical protein n=1 Tax=uncultured Allobacillus sp. TaxID=1638025 RepID=UPI002595F6D6|nr:hypothetical protein [uncultured Allobacillus sp.]